ncbi:MAG: cereblon family protein [Desulfobacterales bacterium]
MRLYSGETAGTFPTELPGANRGGWDIGRTASALLTTRATVRCLRTPDTGRPPEGRIHTQPEPATGTSDIDPHIRCRQCLAIVSHLEDRLPVDGSHHHTFANPAGLVFTIGCFSNAEGCGTVGAYSREFTWFPGYHWRVAVCRRCLSHLGWHFAGSGGGFWGLILDQLVFPQEP